MENRPPLALLLVVIAGAVLITTGRMGQPARVEPHAGAVPPPERAAQTYCDATPDPLKPLCAALFRPQDPSPDDWQQQAWLERARKDLSVVLVMVPDPEQTGDTLSFDRAVESVQNAAESLGYSMFRHWLPWVSAEQRPEAADSKRNRDDPGVLLFRSEAGFLVVFLVGESPVFGVERLQFLNALHYTDVLAPDLDCVRVAGPNFSGSFPSLTEAIQSGVKRRPFRLISASATVKSAGRKFRENAGIRYDSIVHNDTYADDRFREFLRKRWGLEPGDQAVLSESSTAFGFSFRKDPAKKLQVGFPRGISRLRNAYPDASARNLFTPGSGAAQPVAEDRLELPLRGPGQGRDRVQGFSKQQMPVTQEAMLLEIASTLRQHDIRLAQIGATDVLDSIFIAGYLAKAYPELRIYFADSDWLVPRAAERLPLVGSLAVTSFPLIAANQLWTSPDDRRLKPMSSRSEIGLFNAFCALLLEQRDSKNPLLEYSAPGRTTLRPPLWLTAVGTNGYWPIALLDNPEVGGDPLQLAWKTEPAAPQAPQPAPPGRIWQTIFFGLVAGALALGAVVILAQSDAFCRRCGSKLALWAARPEDMGAYGRAYFAMAECLLLGLMVLVMGSPLWSLTLHAGGVFTLVFASSLLAMAVLAVAAVAPWFAIFRRRGAIAGPRGYLFLALLPCLGMAGFIVLWWFVLSRGNDSSLQAFFFAYRSLDLANGVNPVLPLLLLGAGLLAVAFLHHRRHAMFLEMPGALPDLGKDAPLAGVPEALEKAREPLGHPLVSGQPLGWLLAGAGMATMALLPFEGQQSLEGRLYDYLYLSLLILFYALVVLTWARIVLVWLRLQAALDRLACHPLREAIAALPPGYSGSPILEGAGRYCVTEWVAASLSSLRAFLRSVPEAGMARRMETIEEQSRELLSLHHGLPGRLAHLRSLEKLLAHTGTEIADWLQPHWQQGTGDEEAVRAGSRFIAVQYAAFLGRMMLQLRGLLVYVVVGFMLAMISTLVYPFRSHEELVWAGTLSFLVLGIPVAVAVVRMEHHTVVAALTRRGESGHMGATLLRLALYAAGPLVAVVTPHFPALGRFLVSLLQPAVQALR